MSSSSPSVEKYRLSRNAESAVTTPYIVEPVSAHTHSIILLHGLGSNGRKFGTEFLETAVRSDGKSLPQLLPGARFIFPTAKRRRSSAFKRSRLTQWFDIASLDDPAYKRHTQVQGLEESLGEILDLIDQEKSKIPARNILLGGLSQGMAMSVVCLLAMNFPLGGFVGLSGWMPYRQDIFYILINKDENDDDDNPFGDDAVDDTTNGEQSEQAPVIKVTEFLHDLLSVSNARGSGTSATAIKTPIFLGHGAADEKIVPSLGEDARDTLQSIGFAVDWHLYEHQGHWNSVPAEIDDLSNFMEKAMRWTLRDGK